MCEPIEIAELHQDCLVSYDIVTRVGREVRSFTSGEAERFCDEIHERQPIPLAHVIVLSRRGVPYPLIDHALHVLMVIYGSFKEVGADTGAISEEMLERAWDNTMAMASFFESEEDEDERNRLHRLGITGYPEPYLLAYVVGYLRDELLGDGPSIHAELTIGVA